MSFKNNVISGFKWSSISQIVRQGMQFLTLIILARLLSPSDFGVLGIALIITNFIAIFKDLGTSAVIIHKKDISNSLKNTIFYFNCSFGLLATLVLFLIAPVISQIYTEQKLLLILRVLSCNFTISSFSTIHKALLEKELKFNQLAKVEIIATVISSTVSVVLALLGYGVWSLVYQILIITTITTVLLWCNTQWKPNFSFNLGELREVREYSLSLTGYTIFNFFIRNADDFLIGKVLGTQALGYYTLAYRLMLHPLVSISTVIARVMFPVLSKIQEDNARFRFAYLRVVGIIALITFPIIMTISIIAEPLILTFFGEEWKPVISLLLIFTPTAMIQSITTTVGIIYQAKGRTDLMLQWGIFAGILIIFSFVFGLRWGINGVAVAYSFTSFFILFYPSIAIPFKLIDLSIFRLIEILWRSFISSIFMSAIISKIEFFLSHNLPTGWALAILVPLGIFIYLLTSCLINRQQLLAVINLAR
ncbi:Flippase [Hyella patelloides LEGE 07179]|uniref:Flippase n=1 Tax=Hyella patelloides LEGE 07179 TaxID=945734 RepID=A0A563W3Z0_9CYAN|nr:MOP flippase family protein [Hyella patelloides]VEP18394.1 Flippase [Hyella patelloides LEGE 07179]